MSCGEAWYEAKAWQFGIGWNSLSAFNMYGDPSLHIIPSEPRSRQRFVNCRAAPGGDGLSWETAYNDLQDALYEIVRLGMVKEIWVAAGTYKPDRGTGDRADTFRLDKAVEIYGGFTGCETHLEQRDPATNVTVLSGDIGVEDDSSDNSYHVVTFKDTWVGALIDGFTITGGNANGTEQEDKNGGGMYNYLSNPTLTNCIFTGNQAVNNGGALYSCCTWNLLTLNNCIYSENVADKGGAMYLNCAARISNCTFSGNSANLGGGLYNDDESNVILTDSILWGNSDSSGTDELAQIYGRPSIVTYSCIQDTDPNDASVYAGTGNIDDDPLFVSGEFGNYYLSHQGAGQDNNSPCVDAGSDMAANLGMNRQTTRTDGVVDRGILDMGYHYSIPIPADLNGTAIVNLTDFAIIAGDWLLCSDPCDLSCVAGLLCGDINADAYVDWQDLKVLVGNWLNCYVAPASHPWPIDKATNVRLEPVLVWSAGYGVMYHNVYLGTDANAVANADDSSDEFLGTFSSAFFVCPKLRVNTTYYWRIDEIRAACRTAGEIWSFVSDRGVAKEPNPPNAAEAVSIDVVVSWSPGPLAVSHDVYLGTDFNDVNEANASSDEYKGGQTSTVYDLNGLEYETTYYWRIDEVNGPAVWKGDVWCFTTYGVPDSYLVGWWKFDEGEGDIVYDSVGNNHGTVYGAEWTTGQISGALNFDGVDDYVTMPGFILSTNTITFVAWINGWKANDWAGVVFSRSGDTCGMDFGSNDTLHYIWNNNSASTWDWQGGPQIPQNQWVMVALVIEPDKATAYVYT
ncbi:MAG: LamG-like jellyroll fold domain-containing protein, partial [Planctomycetota bacterium]